MTPERITDEEREVIYQEFKEGRLPGWMFKRILDSERHAWAALEETENKVVELWECEDCGFAFDAIHENDTPEGGYSCPLCAESRLEKELAEAHAEIERLNTELLETKEARTVAVNQSKRHKSEASAWEEAHDDLHQVSIKQAESLSDAQQQLVSQTNKLTQAEQTIARLTKALEEIKSEGAYAGNNKYYHIASAALGEGAKTDA